MHSERERDALDDILANIDRALELVDNLSPDTFGQDWRSLYAAVRCLEIISEATRRLSPELLARYPALPWRNIMDSGNIYRHGYDVVNPAQLWRTITTHLPEYRRAVEQELAPDSFE